jgi:hypothetical protein
MIEFHYNVNGENASFTADEEVDLNELIFTAEQTLLAQLQERDLQITADEKQFLVSRITEALSRDMLSGEPIDLGAIKLA